MLQLRTTAKYIRRSPYQAVNAIMIITLTVFLSTIFLTAAYSSQKIIKYYESKPQINVFFKDETTDEQIKKLESTLQGSKKVAKLKYVSKKDALEIYKEQNKSDPLLLEMVTENILPASLEVSAVDARYLNDLYEILKKETGIEEIVYQKEVIDTLTSWTNTIRKVGIVFVSYLTLVCALTIITIVGTKISAKREEIEVMKLLGASNWYIRWPFIAEAIFFGGVAAVFSWTLFYLVIIFSFPFFSAFFSSVPQVYLPVFLSQAPNSLPSLIAMGKMLVTEIIFGTVVSALASTLAAARYLKD